MTSVQRQARPPPRACASRWELLQNQRIDIAIIDVNLQGSISGLDLSWNYQLSVDEQRAVSQPDWLPTVMVVCSNGELSEPELRHDCYNYGMQARLAAALAPSPLTAL